MKPKLKNGQSIRVRPDLNAEKLRNVGPHFSEQMDKTIGQTGIISDVAEEHGRPCYTVFFLQFGGMSRHYLEEWLTTNNDIVIEEGD